jgi:hypothetical protein
MVVSVGSGHSEGYLLGSVSTGRESYYLDATLTGEPAGVWKGAGAAALGLTGEVDPDVMTAVYSGRLDPRDPRFWNPETRELADRLGNGPRAYKTAHEMTVERLAKLANLPADRVDAMRAACRAETGTTGQADRLLETRLGQAVGMLPEEVGQVRAASERAERQNVSFIDVVYSPPKSVTAARVASSGRSWTRSGQPGGQPPTRSGRTGKPRPRSSPG